MFSSAFKSFTSNINSNYEISKQPSASAGPWTVFDAKKRSTGVAASVFIFDRKTLDVASTGGFGARASSTSVRKVQEEVVERLRKEASSLARLRHPSVLQLVEPVEDTRSGGLMFATEQVLSSLSGALEQKDQSSSRSNSRRRGGAAQTEESTNSNLSIEIELDELEIQKGLLQVAKGLEFLHDSAKLVHGNLTPDAIWINAKSDWKISGLAFAGPADGAEGHQSLPQISLSEALHHDPRIPRSVQLNLDYTSPDFVLDSNITFSSDIFSLGLVLLACYRNPHRSPIETHGNQNSYKKIFSSFSTAPSASNNYLCSGNLPRELEDTLPKVLTRRPAQRVNATEFQQSAYFDNVLVNTMRFLDSFPAKTPAEKSQFMRGLAKVMPQFPPSILAKKVLPALLEELKDKELLALILQNIFKIVKMIPSGRQVVSEKILPRVREIFPVKGKSEDRDASREAGLVVVLENIHLIADNCSAQQFKEDMLPVLSVALESPTHTLSDAALQTIPSILPLLDFSTVKHDLFPVVANVFSKTSSLSIKVRGLEAISVLCGAPSTTQKRDDGLAGGSDGNTPKNTSSLDKFTMQEKVVPLIKAIKTKEPAVMMAALKVFRQIGLVADIDFLAIEVMPILWAFALGPLLDLRQFQGYMELLKFLSSKIEKEQSRKLEELGTTRSLDNRSQSMPFSSQANGTARPPGTESMEVSFEKLVLGKKDDTKEPFAGALSDGQKLTQNPPSFSWTSSANRITDNPMAGRNSSPMAMLQPQPPPGSRSITPDVLQSTFPSNQSTMASASNVWSGNTSAIPTFPSFSQPTQVQQPVPPIQRIQPIQPFQASTGTSSFTSPPAILSSNIWANQTQTQAFNNVQAQPQIPGGGIQRVMGSTWTPMLAPPPPGPSVGSSYQPPKPSSPQHSFNGPIGLLQPQVNRSQQSFQQSASAASNQNNSLL